MKSVNCKRLPLTTAVAGLPNMDGPPSQPVSAPGHVLLLSESTWVIPLLRVGETLAPAWCLFPQVACVLSFTQILEGWNEEELAWGFRLAGNCLMFMVERGWTFSSILHFTTLSTLKPTRIMGNLLLVAAFRKLNLYCGCLQSKASPFPMSECNPQTSRE